MITYEKGGHTVANVCPICLNSIVGEICGFHLQDNDHEAMSAQARILADMIHRGVTPTRLPKKERPLAEEDQ